MEGTRHEKVALIIASYLIGFTTAFIAFGVNKLANTEVIVQDNPAQTLNTATVNTPELENSITSVGFGEDGLFAVTAGYERLLSADKKTLSANVSDSVKNTPGFYYNIVDAEASRNGQFVYFCEQVSEDSESCNPYVYSLADDSLYAVKVDGEAYASTIADHKSAWLENNSLKLNDMVSVDGTTPWVFVTTEPEVQ